MTFGIVVWRTSFRHLGQLRSCCACDSVVGADQIPELCCMLPITAAELAFASRLLNPVSVASSKIRTERYNHMTFACVCVLRAVLNNFAMLHPHYLSGFVRIVFVNLGS